MTMMATISPSAHSSSMLEIMHSGSRIGQASIATPIATSTREAVVDMPADAAPAAPAAPSASGLHLTPRQWWMVGAGIFGVTSIGIYLALRKG